MHLSRRPGTSGLPNSHAHGPTARPSASKELGDYLFVKYLDGNTKKETAPGRFARTPRAVAHACVRRDIRRLLLLGGKRCRERL